MFDIAFIVGHQTAGVRAIAFADGHRGTGMDIRQAFAILDHAAT
ncbi:MAG: hypothetical protein WDM86_18585 [Rhizomicrobium sp.]